MSDKDIKYNTKHGITHSSKIASIKPAVPVQYNIMAFNQTELVEKSLVDPLEVKNYFKKFPMIWLQVVGLKDSKILQGIAELFKLNTVLVENVVDLHQTVKIEEYEQACYSTCKIPQLTSNQLHLQPISIFWGKNFVITFVDYPTNCFSPLILRIKNNVPRVHLLSPQYVAYAMLDIVVDAFFPILDVYGAHLDDLESNAIDNPSTAVIEKIHTFKHDLHRMRRAIWQQREAISSFKEIVMEAKDMWFYVRDCEDHTIQLLDIVENYTDRGSGLMDIYLVSVNNRTNQIVKQLTIIATVFMPIGVLAGIYGMNYDRSSPYNLPELGWRFGYEYFWCVVITFASSMLCLFWRKGWFKR